MIAVIGLIIGIVLGVLLDPTVPAWLTPFLPVAVVAGLDALFGAGRAWLEGRFADRVFVTSFFWNVVVACLPGYAARCRLGNDDGGCRRSWHPYLLQHGIDSPPTTEGLR